MLNLLNLTEGVREKMLIEIDADFANGGLYFSERFNENGNRLYVSLLREAAQKFNDGWLADSLVKNNCFEEHEIRNTRTGPKPVRVPYTAASTHAEGEFNRYYLRALCVVAVETNIPFLIIYRARQSENPRPQSQAMTGKLVPAKTLLDDLRTNNFVETVFGLPPGPNSGLSARLP